MRILYITYDGLTDPLGQSQILPYLTGLSQLGHSITILSAEKDFQYSIGKDLIESTVQKYDIKWVPLKYHNRPKVISTLQDVRSLKASAKELHLKNRFDLVHCRSYITSIVGLWLKRKYQIKFIFDMRGFWADERVDGRIWNLKNPVYAAVYSYFKRKEVEFLNEADHTITLTQKAKVEIHSWTKIKQQPVPIQVIPCCTDFELFDYQNISATETKALRQKMGFADDDFTITYLGSIGTWYMLEEMMQFFKELVAVKKSAKFLFITTEPKAILYKEAAKHGIPKESIIVTHANRQQVPAMLSLSDMSLFFIKPVYSKLASCPTKLGEALGMGIPIIANAGVGDVDEILSDSQHSLVLKKLDPRSYQEGISRIDAILQGTKNEVREIGINYCSLEGGIRKYDEIYASLAQASDK